MVFTVLDICFTETHIHVLKNIFKIDSEMRRLGRHTAIMYAVTFTDEFINRLGIGNRLFSLY